MRSPFADKGQLQRVATVAPTSPQGAELIPTPVYSQFTGGAITVAEKGLLPPGSASMIQNFRQVPLGQKQRAGQAKLHTTADGTNRALTLFQFSKGRAAERITYAQMSDGDVLKATTAPPGVTTGAFGGEAFDGSTGQGPASWAVLDDVLFHANRADQHQVYPGTGSYVDRFIVYKDTSFPTIPEKGEDYSKEVSNTLTTDVAILDSLSNIAAFDCIFIKTAVPAKQFTWTLKTGKENVTASVGDINYWNGAWTDLTVVDNTKNGTPATLAQNGSMTYTAPTDIIPHYLFGECGYWYQFHLDSGDLDAEVEVQTITYEADWQKIDNVWDGVPVNAVEVQVYTKATDSYATYPSSSVDIGGLVADAAGGDDWIYFSSLDPLVGFYVDVAGTPNVNDTTVLYQVQYWNGTAFADAAETDGTSGFGSSGWITFGRQSAVQETHWNNTKYHAYWYRVSVNTANVSADVIISITTMPYFDISDFGSKGFTCCPWKGRMVYSFNEFPQFLYVSAHGKPLSLNGSDFAPLLAGDGRSNKIVAMKNVLQELIVFQEEKGTGGGCITMFQGTIPGNFGESILSTTIGSFNAKSVAIVEGAKTSTQTDEKIGTRAYFISHSGIMVANFLDDIEAISDDIQNYFDPTGSECIRRGQEDEMWLGVDSAYNVIKVGLICSHTEDDCADDDSGDWSIAIDIVNSAIAFSSDHYTLSSNGDANEIFYLGGLNLRKGWSYRLLVDIKDGTESSETIHLVNLNGTTVETSTSAATTATSTTKTHDFIATADTDGFGIRIPADLAGDNVQVKNVILQQYVYPVYNLAKRNWSFDAPGQKLSCMAEIEAATGENPILQIGGGVDDGFIYRLNTGTNDVSAGIDAFIRLEFGYLGLMIECRDAALRMKTQAAGDVTITPYLNGVAQTALTKSMTANATGDLLRRWRLPDLQEIATEQMSLEFRNNTASQEIFLYDLMVWLNADETK